MHFSSLGDGCCIPLFQCSFDRSGPGGELRSGPDPTGPIKVIQKKIYIHFPGPCPFQGRNNNKEFRGEKN